MANWPPKKNTAFNIAISLYNGAGAMLTNPTLASGDLTYSLDFGAFGTPATLLATTPGTSGQVKIPLTAAEMNGDVVHLQLVDQTSPAEWMPWDLTIYTASQQMGDAAPVSSGTVTIVQGGTVVAGTVSDKTGYTVSAGTIAIVQGGTVVAGTVSDKTGYTVSAGTINIAQGGTVVASAGTIDLVKAGTLTTNLDKSAYNVSSGTIDLFKAGTVTTGTIAIAQGGTMVASNYSGTSVASNMLAATDVWAAATRAITGGTVTIAQGGTIVAGTVSDKTGYTVSGGTVAIVQGGTVVASNYTGTAVVSGTVAANIKQVNGVTVNGDGSGTTWGP